VHGFHQHQQRLYTRSSSSSRCSAHSLRAAQHGHVHASSSLAVMNICNSISLASFPRLLQRRAGRQLLPPPAATEDASSAGGPLQDSSRGGSSSRGGVTRSGGRGRGSSSKRSWEGSNSSGSSDRRGVGDGGSQESSWQAQAQHGRGGSSSSRGRGGHSGYMGRGGGRLNSAGSGDSSGSDSVSDGLKSSSSTRRSNHRGSSRGKSGSNVNNVSSSGVQQDRPRELVRRLLLAGSLFTHDVCYRHLYVGQSVSAAAACALRASHMCLHQCVA
jgi:hypothetical protein